MRRELTDLEWKQKVEEGESLYSLYLQATSSSIPENPNALSPWIQNTCPFSPVSLWLESRTMRLAAIAYPHPRPIVAKVPASSLEREKHKYVCVRANVCACVWCAFVATYIFTFKHTQARWQQGEPLSIPIPTLHLCFGRKAGMTVLPMSIVLEPSFTTTASRGR